VPKVTPATLDIRRAEDIPSVVAIAKALRLSIPPALLTRADVVIE